MDVCRHNKNIQNTCPKSHAYIAGIYTDTIKKCPLYIYVNSFQTNAAFFIQLFCFKKRDYLTMLCAEEKFIPVLIYGNDNPQAPVPILRQSHNISRVFTAVHPCLTERSSCWIMELNLCKKSRHLNNGQFKSKRAILKITPV